MFLWIVHVSKLNKNDFFSYSNNDNISIGMHFRPPQCNKCVNAFILHTSVTNERNRTIPKLHISINWIPIVVLVISFIADLICCWKKKKKKKENSIRMDALERANIIHIQFNFTAYGKTQTPTMFVDYTNNEQRRLAKLRHSVTLRRYFQRISFTKQNHRMK